MRDDGGRAEIIGDQTEAARLLSEAYAETRRLDRHGIRPEFAQVTATLDRLRGTLGQLTHWDIRPARTVSLLTSLARFLTDRPVTDGGQGQFGDLTLPAIEKLAEAWAHELDVFWIEAKEAVSQRSASGGEIPDYLGIDATYSAFCAQPDEVRVAIRVRMHDLIGACRVLSEGEPVDILSRVAVIFEAQR